MGILDSLGKAAKAVGGKALHVGTALPGAIWDTATYVVPGDFLPGDRGYGDFSDYLNSLGGRANDFAFTLPVTQTVGKGMEGLNWAYHEGIDRPISTAWIEAQHAGASNNLGSFFSADDWAKSYDIADKQSLGKTFVQGVTNLSGQTEGNYDPFSYDPSKGTPFEQGAAAQNPVAANVTALGVDLTASWFLDPTVLAGKAGAVARSKNLAKINAGERSTFGHLLDGSIDSSSKAESWTNRTDKYIQYITGDNKLGRPLNAAEIRGSSVELQRSRGSLAISSALEKAAAIEDPVEAGDAVRRVLAVAAGDQGAINSLAVMGSSSKSLADRLNNILSEQTVQLTEQALNDAKSADPVFRAAFNKQISNWNDAEDLGKQLTDWSTQVQADLRGIQNLQKDVAGTLDYLPGVHSSTGRRLAHARGEDLTTKVGQKHDELVNKALPVRDSYSFLKQDGLGSVPLMAIYPARLLASTLPTSIFPKIVNGLRTVHYTGVANLHDWNQSVDQINSMLIHAGADNETRLGVVSKAMGLRTETEKTAMIHEAEQHAMDAIRRTVGEKHGIEIDSEFVNAALRQGWTQRGNALAAQNGTRYSATAQSGAVLDRSRSLRRAQMETKLDKTLSSAERQRQMTLLEDTVDNWTPTVDQFLSGGTPYTLPVMSSELANRVPMMDVPGLKTALNDFATAERLRKKASAWRDLSDEAGLLERQVGHLRGSQYDRKLARLQNVRKMQEALLGTMSTFNRFWKMEVLFRLGYPMRVLADDHMRIAARMGYIPFLMDNLPEAARNSYYNFMPGFLARGKAGVTRKGDSYLQWEQVRQGRRTLRLQLGRKTAHTDEEWTELNDLVKAKLSGNADDAAHARLRELDPEGRVEEYIDLKGQLGRHNRSAAAHRGQLAALREQGAPAAQIHAKEQKLAEAEGNARAVSEMLAGRTDPNEVRTQIRKADEILARPAKELKPEKRRVGSADIETEAGTFKGAFSNSAAAWRHAASSDESWTGQLLPELEGSAYHANSSGAWRDISPGQPGYYQFWANVLNHQFQHSPEMMAFVRGEVKSPQEFAAWLRHEDRANLRERMYYYAHDAEDWGGRLQAMSEDYLAHSDELRTAVAKGRVTPKQLQKMFGDGDARRPVVHGQAVDVNSGRATATRMANDAIARAFSKIATQPTDVLSRQPFFNAVYRREIREAADAHIAQHGGEAFSDADRMAIEKRARDKALQELKTTLWDVSAHSSLAHTLRFVSPFLAAHQEALNRWWNIARDDPSVARRFVLAFDAPRKAGMVIDPQTGEPVEPGAPIGQGHRILLRVPFAGKNNAVNKWLDKHGVGGYSVSENGLNLILQNGLANPGVGPMVTIPVEFLVSKYPEATEFEKAARVLNQYPPQANTPLSIAREQLLPGWGKHMLAYAQGPGNVEFGRYYAQNFADDLVTFNKMNGRPPSEEELSHLEDQANKETHRDLLVMSMTNAAFFTPARPSSRYTAVQNGLQKLYDQMQTQGHDMEWLRQTFAEKYGEVYLPLIYSMGTNPAQLEGSPAEVSAIKKYSGLTRKIDPSLVRMVIGPEVSSASETDQMYSQSAAAWQSGQASGNPGETLRSRKDPEALARAQVVQQGWTQYDQMVNYLDYLADQRGEDKGYEAYDDLVAKKKAGLAYIQQSNPVFAHDYESYASKSFDKLVDQMRMIASNRTLANDPSRPDIYWLSQFIQVRDSISAALQQRASAGGNKTLDAQANSDLAQMYRNAVTYINSQSPYFKQFAYPVVEKDPYLNPTEGQ